MNGMLSAALLVLAALALPGCLINSSSRTEYSGRYVGVETYNQIEPGVTREDFVLATFGEPTSKTDLQDGSSIWKWSYQKTKSGHGTVFLILNANEHTESQGAAYVIIKDGLVTKKWRD
jgi:outer membrane protein assembly factor BamE (lipoprotein component of BamABCDE complex)